MNLAWKRLVSAAAAFFLGTSCFAQTVSSNPKGVFVAGGEVLASARQSDNKVIIGGRFIAINGVPRQNLARLNEDGSVDLTWNPAPNAGSVYNNSNVTAIAVHGNTVYVSGTFSFVGGQPRDQIAAIDGTTGLATPWDPGSSNGGATFSALAVSEDGSTVYVGGFFSSVGGADRNYIAALSASDGGALPDWNPGPSAQVYALALSGNALYVGGIFQTIGGQSRANLALVDATTGAVSPWDPNPDGGVSAIAIAGGIVYVGGSFQNVQGHSRIAAFDVSTQAVQGWDPGITFTVGAIARAGNTVFIGGSSVFGAYQGYLVAADASSAVIQNWAPNPDWRVHTLTPSGNSLFVGGEFRNIGGNVTGGFAILDPVTADSANRQLAGSAGYVSALQAQPDGKVIVGGTFTSISDVPRANLGRLNADGTVDESWNPAPDGAVAALLVSGNIVYVGGEFENIGSHFRQGLAALDLGTAIATTWQPDPDGEVYAIAAANGVVYVGGSFLYVGNAMRSRIAALDPSSGLATDWNPGADGTVLRLTPTNGVVYAAGYFGNIGGSQRRSLAAIDPASGIATPWNPNPEYAVLAMIASQSTLYIGGGFSTVAQTAHPTVAAIDLASGLVTSWNGNPTYNGGDVEALALADDRLIVGGFFYNMGGQPRQNLADLDTQSGLASAWNVPVADNENQGNPTALAVSGGRIFVGGSFDSVGGLPRSSLAMITAPGVIFASGFE